MIYFSDTSSFLTSEVQGNYKTISVYLNVFLVNLLGSCQYLPGFEEKSPWYPHQRLAGLLFPGVHYSIDDYLELNDTFVK